MHVVVAMNLRPKKSTFDDFDLKLDEFITYSRRLIYEFCLVFGKHTKVFGFFIFYQNKTTI